jgi:hypothetical protein
MAIVRNIEVMLGQTLKHSVYDYVILCNAILLAYFSYKGRWGLCDNHSLSVRLCDPLLIFEAISIFLWSSLGDHAFENDLET